MAELLSGVQVAEDLCQRIAGGVSRLKEQGTSPKAAIVRVGERPADLAYERGFVKRAASLGIEVQTVLLPEETREDVLIGALEEINQDRSIHGCLLFRPLPGRLHTQKVLETLRPEKDVDAMTSSSMGGLMAGAACFPPCTASACLELLDFYQVPLKGRNIVIVGSGAAVGMPTSILLMNRGATVSVCNVFTAPERLTELCRGADVIISAAGCAGLIGQNRVRPGQVVLDVGLSRGADGRLRGDVDFDQVEPIVAAITPVPGGVGAVTSTVLAAHTVRAALRAHGMEDIEETGGADYDRTGSRTENS